MTDVYVLGIGQRFPHHLTLETLEILEECEVVYTLLPDTDICILPDALARKCHSIWPLYRPDRLRDQNYAEASDLILKSAKDTPPVGWLTWGNPRVLDTVSQTIVARGAERDLSVEVFSAVSSIDTVLVDVDYDPASGLMVVEGTTALIRQTTLVPNVATLIFQPGVFGTFYPRLRADDRKIDLSPLRDYLLRYYEMDHELAFVSSSNSRRIAASVSWTTVGQLPNISSTLLRASTIYIPPVKGQTIDETFVALVESAE